MVGDGHVLLAAWSVTAYNWVEARVRPITLAAWSATSYSWVEVRGQPIACGSGGIHSKRRGKELVVCVVVGWGSASMIVGVWEEIGVVVGGEVACGW